jgi:hypothetical protein
MLLQKALFLLFVGMPKEVAAVEDPKSQSNVVVCGKSILLFSSN